MLWTLALLATPIEKLNHYRNNALMIYQCHILNYCANATLKQRASEMLSVGYIS